MVYIFEKRMLLLYVSTYITFFVERNSLIKHTVNCVFLTLGQSIHNMGTNVPRCIEFYIVFYF